MKNIQKCLNSNRIDFLMNYDCTCKGEKRSFTDLIYNRICRNTDSVFGRRFARKGDLYDA